MKKSIARTCNGMFCSSVIRNIFGNGAPAVAILLLSFFVSMSISAYAFPKDTLENLIDENRLLSEPTEANPKRQLNELKGILEVEFDTIYTEPVVFAGQLTAEDNFVSTLRYYTSGDNKMNIFKQREMSGGTSTIHEDQMGWMAIDLAPNRPGVVLNSKVAKQLNSVAFYPNPAKYILYFNFTRSSGVEIINLAGQKLLESDVLHSLDVSSLTAGLNLLNADGVLNSMFIKE